MLNSFGPGRGGTPILPRKATGIKEGGWFCLRFGREKMTDTKDLSVRWYW